MRNVLLVLTLAIALTGCSARDAEAPPEFPTGSTKQQIVVDGVSRDFRVFIPEGLSAPAPLVIMLHGGRGTALQAEDSYDWDAEAVAKGFVVAYAEAEDGAWNVASGCCGQPGVDDVKYLTAVVAELTAKLSIDESRVFATGFSNGGMMAYRLACDTDLFAAIGLVAGTLLGDCADPAPVSVIHIHGLADTVIPFESADNRRPAIAGPPIEEVLATFAQSNDCEPPAPTTDGLVVTSVASCPGGRAVELITIEDAGHEWPSLSVDSPSTGLDATATIWAFFAEHSKD